MPRLVYAHATAGTTSTAFASLSKSSQKGSLSTMLALLLTNSFGSALAVWHAGVPERWGYRRDGRGRLLTRAVRVKDATRGSAHHADYYAALVKSGQAV